MKLAKNYSFKYSQTIILKAVEVDEEGRVSTVSSNPTEDMMKQYSKGKQQSMQSNDVKEDFLSMLRQKAAPGKEGGVGVEEVRLRFVLIPDSSDT